MSTTESSQVGTPRIITDSEFVAAVHTVLKERGGSFVYEAPITDQGEFQCLYSADGATGSCLFGAALIDELDVAWSDTWEGATISQVLRGHSDGREIVTPGVEFQISSPVLMASVAAQSEQDDGLPYDDVEDTFFGTIVAVNQGEDRP